MGHVYPFKLRIPTPEASPDLIALSQDDAENLAFFFGFDLLERTILSEDHAPWGEEWVLGTRLERSCKKSRDQDVLELGLEIKALELCVDGEIVAIPGSKRHRNGVWYCCAEWVGGAPDYKHREGYLLFEKESHAQRWLNKHDGGPPLIHKDERRSKSFTHSWDFREVSISDVAARHGRGFKPPKGCIG